jgi:ribosomal RNA-processing protein 36
MSSVKRKVPPASLLQRRVRPRYEPEPESDIEDDASEAPSEEGAVSFGSDEEGGQVRSEDESGSGSDVVSLMEHTVSQDYTF